ncbi:MAG: hypothetical protein H7336_00315 [Bacteriovorax sp.]|nr:hypothetical protein [Bacteriovorax sp.]
MKIALIILFSTFLVAADDSALGSFKVKVSNIRISKKLYIDSAFAKKYKKLMLEEFKKGPNFDNQFRIVRIGCGSSCTQIAVINMEKGKIYQTDLMIDGSGDWIRGDILQYMQESSLLIMSGCLQEDKTKCGHHEYSWQGDHFKAEFFRSNQSAHAPDATISTPAK